MVTFGRPSSAYAVGGLDAAKGSTKLRVNHRNGLRVAAPVLLDRGLEEPADQEVISPAVKTQSDMANAESVRQYSPTAKCQVAMQQAEKAATVFGDSAFRSRVRRLAKRPLIRNIALAAKGATPRCSSKPKRMRAIANWTAGVG